MREKPITSLFITELGIVNNAELAEIRINQLEEQILS